MYLCLLPFFNIERILNMSLLEITNLSHTFGDNPLYKNAELTLNKGEHIGIVGQNGAGKSTLIKICTEQVIPDKGHIAWQSNIAVGYLDQYAEIEKQITMRDFLRSEPLFHFPTLPVTETEHLQIKHLSVGYYYPILSDISFSVIGGQKIVITGFNGAGKSTLLKTLVGQLAALKGHFAFSEQVKLGYLEQDLLWEDSSRTPIQIVSDKYPALVVKEIRKSLARCSISSKHAMQAIGTLSGGEQAKVKICLLTLTSYNFIIMDEPTNHLDELAKEALKTAIAEFPGTVLLVSHEEKFYRDWAQKVIDIANTTR